ncbi:MAG TPA: hypothetical protein GXX28_05655 [Firmicutes bacterium]|nr:hypothetical protein [Bacillota bacterium]
MERGQSTIEVAIAFPLVVVALWWALAAPLTGTRSLAVRLAGLAGARQAAVEDAPDTRQTGRIVEAHWQRLGGGGGGKQVAVSLAGDTVTVTAREIGHRAGRAPEFTLALRRERD